MSAPNPLIPLHADTRLSPAKLAFFEKMSSESLKQSLLPWLEHSLKCRPDGTMLDGHHRIAILKRRGEEIDALPREVLNPY